jgi:peptidylprolyl isomerase
MLRIATLVLVAMLSMPALAAKKAPPTTAEVLAQSQPEEWRAPDPAYTLLLELDAQRRVLIELAPRFAPNTVQNILTLVGQHYFDGLPIVRVQDNYVVQWGDPASGTPDARSLGEARATLAPEFAIPKRQAEPFAKLKDPDSYAREVGVVDSLPVAGDGRRRWLAHCYGMVGVGRGDTADSGSGAELYVVTGHSPRHLDRNVVLVGRVLDGIQHLSSLPRGDGAMGFFTRAEQRIPIRQIRRLADVPEAERPALTVLRSDSASFKQLIEARRHRREPWFLHPTGRLELCNLPLPVRARGGA